MSCSPMLLFELLEVWYNVSGEPCYSFTY